jgi:hypothetical protein
VVFSATKGDFPQRQLQGVNQMHDDLMRMKSFIETEEFHMMRGPISLQHLPQLEAWRGLVK